MKRILGTLSAAAVLSMSFSAGAVLHDQDFVDARKNAMHHLQAKITKHAVPNDTPGDCRIWAEVARVFKGRTRFLTKGRPLEFNVSCKRDNDLIPTGDTLWMEVEDLRAATYLEIYLNSKKQGNLRVFSIPNWQSMIIGKPTRNPKCPDSETGRTCR